MKFEIYRENGHPQYPIRVRFEKPDGTLADVASPDLIWGAAWLSDDWRLTSDEFYKNWANDPEFRTHVSNPDDVIPAIGAYLRAWEEAVKTGDPELKKNVNSITGWIESIIDVYPPSKSRKI